MPCVSRSEMFLNTPDSSVSPLPRPGCALAPSCRLGAGGMDTRAPALGNRGEGTSNGCRKPGCAFAPRFRGTVAGGLA